MPPSAKGSVPRIHDGEITAGKIIHIASRQSSAVNSRNGGDLRVHFADWAADFLFARRESGRTGAQQVG